MLADFQYWRKFEFFWHIYQVSKREKNKYFRVYLSEEGYSSLLEFLRGNCCVYTKCESILNFEIRCTVSSTHYFGSTPDRLFQKKLTFEYFRSRNLKFQVVPSFLAYYHLSMLSKWLTNVWFFNPFRNVFLRFYLHILEIRWKGKHCYLFEIWN